MFADLIRMRSHWVIERILALNGEALLATDPRLAAILETLSQIAAGNWAAHATVTGSGDMLDRIIEQLSQLAAELSARHTALIESEQRFEEFLDVISGMAALDFTKKAQVGEEGTRIDAMAFGINMLSEELAVSTVSRAYVDNIIESLLDALVVVDQRRMIKTVNRAAIQLFGYPKEALVAQPIAMLFAQPEAAEQVLAAMTHTTGARTHELTGRASDGRAIPVSLSAAALYQADGNVQDIVCTIRDMTERQQADQALRRSIAQEETIRAQAAMVAELSTPLIPISAQVVVMPLIGAVDSRRARQVLETLLSGIATTSVEVAILDITGVPVVDTQVANALIQAAQAAKLLGARVMLTGIRPEVAQTLVGLGVDLRGIVTHSTLQSGIAAVLRHG
jgi:rsbT co-antagonist protein RsbR